MNRLSKYLIITFSITWSCWLTEAALTNFWALDLVQYPRVLFVIGGFGTTIAAALCGEGPFSLRGAAEFLFGHRSRSLWAFGLARAARDPRFRAQLGWLGSGTTAAGCPRNSYSVFYLASGHPFVRWK